MQADGGLSWGEKIPEEIITTAERLDGKQLFWTGCMEVTYSGWLLGPVLFWFWTLYTTVNLKTTQNETNPGLSTLDCEFAKNNGVDLVAQERKMEMGMALIRKRKNRERK